jgi:hypothetical protein
VQKHCGREYGIAPEVVEGIQFIAYHHVPPKAILHRAKSPPLDLPL